MKTIINSKFNSYYELHCKHLKLKGLQPKTIEALSQAIRRIGECFDYRLDDLTKDQLLEYFYQLKEKSSWSTVKLDLYGLKFFYLHVLQRNWVPETLKVFCLNDKKLGGIPGAIAVLHTHSRELNFHAHIHIVMPAAAIDKNRRLWTKKSGKYLFNHKALAKVFRAKMLDSLTGNDLKLPSNYPEDWVVDCRHVGAGDKALLYLSRYLYRGVISEKDIISCDNGKVTFRYKNSKTVTYQTKTVSAVHFLWLVLQHILPRGFRRAREYGFLHPNSKKLIKILQWVFRLNPQKWITKLKPRKQMVCSFCGAFMKIVTTRLPSFTTLPELHPL